MHDSVPQAWLAVLVGGGIAAAVLLHDGWRPGGLPVDAVALVGERPIARADWLRAVAAVESDRGRVLEPDDRERVLEHLIDEELLLQHALDSDFVRNDPGLRKTVIAALVEAGTQGRPPDEAEARALFEQHPEDFAGAARLRVVVLQLKPGQAPPSQDDISAALRSGVSPPSMRRLDLPAAPLAPPQLAQRVGGSLAQALTTASVDQLIGPVNAAGATCYAMVLERRIDRPRYEDVAEAVRGALSRREADQALARLLQSLRTEIPIRMAADAQRD
ncbi:hypothetical protein E4T66_08545 [Sinimarinibacterium sp. CAU 1509]|nr:hypothetical protein E4T66_08545 [Sinimarinibacterium sp. CAU 1509]